MSTNITSTPERQAVTYVVTANLPGYDGPFVLELLTYSPDAARRRAMFSLMAAGYFDPQGSPDEALALFTAEPAA